MAEKGFSNYLINKLLDHVLGGGDYSRPATVYIALATAEPSDASISEVTYTSYVRKAVTNNATNFPAASGGSKSNGVVLEFVQSTGGSSTATHFAILDADVAGNILGWGPLSTSRTIESGDIPRFAVGELVVTHSRVTF